MVAALASYFGTAAVFLNAHVASGAETDRSTFGPLSELFLANPGAWDFSMGDCPTTHTHFLTAFALCHILEEPVFLDIFVASALWTPFEIRVTVNVDIQLEADVFFEDFFGAERFHVFFGKDLLAAVALHAGDLLNLPILNICFQVIS